jgi:hypothetical protein
MLWDVGGAGFYVVACVCLKSAAGGNLGNYGFGVFGRRVVRVLIAFCNLVFFLKMARIRTERYLPNALRVNGIRIARRSPRPSLRSSWTLVAVYARLYHQPPKLSNYVVT